MHIDKRVRRRITGEVGVIVALSVEFAEVSFPAGQVTVPIDELAHPAYEEASD